MAAPTAASRPGRTLTVLALIIVVLYAVMLLTQHLTPKLALDLRGGTQVVLTAKPAETGGQITKSNMDQAVDIIRNRVNAFGVSEAEVTVQGTKNVIVSIPGKDQSVASQVGRTALLHFRPVLMEAAAGVPATSTPTPTPGGSATPSATPSAKASASPSSSPSKQGRVLSDGLRAAPSPTPTPTPAATPTAPAQTTPDATANAQGVSPALQKQFAEIDCSKLAAVTDAANKVKPTEPLVTCGQTDGAKYVLGPVAVAGKDLSSANAGLPQNGAEWQVNLSFNGKGTRQFADTTRALVNQQPPRNQFAIVLDGIVVSAPRVDEPITAGQAEIRGQFSQKEATDLANVLKYGALPLAFEQSEVTQVSATLGSDQMRAGVIAGLIGLVLVVLYSILYYRGLALVTVLSLVIAGLLTYAVAVLLGPLIGFTLSLPGIAGLIVAVGITADSFVVFFERLRDEVREGRTLRAAVEHGWTRARRTIIAADLVSIFAAGALYFLSVGSVKGFAFTLGVTTVIDLVIVFLFTKPLVAYLSRTKFFGQGHRFSGLDPARLGAKPRPATTTTRRRTAGVKEA